MFIESKKYNRRFVVSDVHGCLDTLQRLIKKIDLQHDDALFFLGDYIDKGPNSVGVLDYIINLINSNFNVFTLRGNHEQDFLEMFRTYKLDFFYAVAKRMLKSDKLLRPNGEILPKYLSFLENTKYYFELEDFLLVHAGFNFLKDDFLKDTSSMLQRRFWELSDLKITNGKRVIHGHDPTPCEDIKRAVENKNARIPLDNGCVYAKLHKFYDYKKLSKLCCLELNSWTLTCIKNEKDIVIKKKRMRK